MMNTQSYRIDSQQEELNDCQLLNGPFIRLDPNTISVGLIIILLDPFVNKQRGEGSRVSKWLEENTML
jgi:hypothetical protein